MKSEYKEIISKAKKNRTSGEISIQFMDHKKLKKKFGWKPKKNMDKAIPELFRWYKNYLENENRF